MNKNPIASLIDGAAALGVRLTEEQAHSFMLYKKLLIEWNSRVNLTAITSDADIQVKHFYDSLSVVPFVNGARTVADVGTGAGFPGIPIKISQPETRLTLVDSLRKRLLFLEALISALNLENITTLHARAEDAGRSAQRNMYDAVVSRAVAPMPLLAEYCLPLAAVGGCFIAMKGPNVSAELADALELIETLGGEVWRVVDTTLPNAPGCADLNARRTIIVVKKIRQTPVKYPRTSAILTKLYKKTDA